MKCNCINDMVKAVDEMIIKDLPEHIEYKSHMSGLMFSFEHGNMLTIPVNYEFRLIKKDRTPAKNRTKKSFSIQINYCPFCRAKVNEEKEYDIDPERQEDIEELEKLLELEDETTPLAPDADDI